jgi:DnaK suppressor protein
MSAEPLDGAALARFGRALERQRDDLRTEIASLGADPDTDDVTFVDDAGFADRSHSTEERSRAIALVGAHRSTLRSVERALARIEAGVYGACERCGEAIAIERLEAIPWATLCIRHAHEATR